MKKKNAESRLGNIHLEKRPQRHWMRAFLGWLPALAWMGFIYYLSAQTQPPTLAEPLLQAILSYGFHVAEYAILAALIVWALGGKPSARVLFISLLIVGLYAMSDEYHQSFVPNRSADMLDVLADLIGAGSVLAIIGLRSR